jgi:hypothetical protein
MKSQKKNNAKKTYSRKNKRTERNVKKNSRTKKMIGGFIPTFLDSKLKDLLENSEQDTECNLREEMFQKADVDKLYAVLMSDQKYLNISYLQNYPDVKVNTHLKELDISNCTFLPYESTDTYINKIFTALSFNKNLTTFKMSGIHINQVNALKLDNVLKINKTLKKLDISNCGITDDSMNGTSLSKSLNKKLEELDISNNKFTDTMLLHFLSKLLENTTLKILKMSGIKIQGDSIDTLASVLELNETLTTLDISNCGISDDKYEQIIGALIKNKNSKLTKLTISNTEKKILEIKM